MLYPAMHEEKGNASSRTTVLVYLRENPALYRELLIDSDQVEYRFCTTEDEAAKEMEHAEVILGSISFPATLLSLARRLRWIQVTGAGVDRFLAAGDLPEGVVLTRADVAFGDQIAEYVIGHLLAVTQRLREVSANQRARRWEPLTLSWLKGSVLGIAGAGSIGRAVASRAAGMGMHTLGLARSPRKLAEF